MLKFSQRPGKIYWTYRSDFIYREFDPFVHSRNHWKIIVLGQRTRSLRWLGRPVGIQRSPKLEFFQDYCASPPILFRRTFGSSRIQSRRTHCPSTWNLLFETFRRLRTRPLAPKANGDIKVGRAAFVAEEQRSIRGRQPEHRNRVVFADLLHKDEDPERSFEDRSHSPMTVDSALCVDTSSARRHKIRRREVQRTGQDRPYRGDGGKRQRCGPSG